MLDLFASLVTAFQPPMLQPAPPLTLIDNARVVRVSPRPTAGSGVLMVLTDFDVLTADMRRLRMSMIYFGQDQFLPPLGSICRIGFYPAGIRGDDRARHPNIVDELSCDTGRDHPYSPPGPARIDGVTIIGVTPPAARHARTALYDAVDIDSPGRAFRRLYLRRGEAVSLPAVGARCDIAYRSDWVSGRALGRPRVEGEFVRVLEALDCAPASAQRGSPNAR